MRYLGCSHQHSFKVSKWPKTLRDATQPDKLLLQSFAPSCVNGTVKVKTMSIGVTWLAVERVINQ